ncbi:hypothetical protein KCP69_25675 [Salmonella enterica subsp. enterica]|nr:hypothetical protein KCP69_25675 [Salmonella enterica subsp. enterica]
MRGMAGQRLFRPFSPADVLCERYLLNGVIADKRCVNGDEPVPPSPGRR